MLSVKQRASFKTYVENIASSFGPGFSSRTKIEKADDLHDMGMYGEVLYKGKTVATVTLTRTRKGSGFFRAGQYMLEAGATDKDGRFVYGIMPAVDEPYRNQTKPPRKLLSDIVKAHPAVFRKCAPVSESVAERAGAKIFFIS